MTSNDGTFTFPATLKAVKMSAKEIKGEVDAKRVFTLTLEVDENQLARGDVPLGENGAVYGAATFAGLARKSVRVTFAAADAVAVQEKLKTR